MIISKEHRKFWADTFNSISSTGQLIHYQFTQRFTSNLFPHLLELIFY